MPGFGRCMGGLFGRQTIIRMGGGLPGHALTRGDCLRLLLKCFNDRCNYDLSRTGVSFCGEAYGHSLFRHGAIGGGNGRMACLHDSTRLAANRVALDVSHFHG